MQEESKYLVSSPPLSLDDKFITRVHQHRHLGVLKPPNISFCIAFYFKRKDLNSFVNFHKSSLTRKLQQWRLVETVVTNKVRAYI